MIFKFEALKTSINIVWIGEIFNNKILKAKNITFNILKFTSCYFSFSLKNNRKKYKNIFTYNIMF